mmetsp:Transcript_87346/g.267290  ORF Transcript_87346/g.267290 Transcript_87346/m.267290 type:complete len:130 (-) Transcript_87346:70-459(-)
MGGTESVVTGCRSMTCRDPCDDRETPEVKQVMGEGKAGMRRPQYTDPLRDECIEAREDGSFRPTDTQPSTAEQGAGKYLDSSRPVHEDDSDEEDGLGRRPKLSPPSVHDQRLQNLKVVSSMCCSAVGCQ